MKLSNFYFELPEKLIAQYPVRHCEDARMIVLHRKSGEIEHKQVKDIIEYFGDGDVVVLNDSKVFPARLYGQKEKTNAQIEVFLLRELNHKLRYWDVLVEPARKIRIGNKIFFDEDNTIVAEVVDNTTSRGRTLRFLSDYDEEEFIDRLYAMGNIPTPKYIRRPMDEETAAKFKEEFDLDDEKPINEYVKEIDAERYQSVVATHVGAVAVPSASMQFSKNLLKRMEIAGIEYGCLTSHVGLGNFRPIDVEDLSKHKVEAEQFFISAELAEQVNKAQREHKHICAVGTEIIRAMEHIVSTSGMIKEFSGWTNRFIYPPFDFTVANAFFNNLYMPYSSQLMMVASFGGYENVMKAYREAVAEGYRFGDYGDAMLIVD